MRFHLLGPAHVHLDREITVCAFAQRVMRFPKMMSRFGHEIFLYAVKGSMAPEGITEIIEIDTGPMQDWRTSFFSYEPNLTFNGIAIREINARKQDGDLLLVTTGNNQQAIAEATQLPAIEYSIGYPGTFAQHRVFQTYAWMHHVYGLTGQRMGNMADAVIPNFFDPEDFPFYPEKLGYFLYVGRVSNSKGIGMAVEATKRLDATLIIAGQKEPGEWDPGSHAKYVGCVGPRGREKLLGLAKAVFVPTYYIEPFGGIAIEAAFCGTPTITTDWGAFTETVLHGVTGYRCHTLADFIWAAQNIGKINPHACHEWAMNFSMEKIGPLYQDYFHGLTHARCMKYPPEVIV